ncbi:MULTISPECIES: UPF0280 family protein [Alphaproteobacteria]|uniref:Thiamine biosynthesis protein ApbE n=2 Tax=Alphaproteobacteria TaxID=28211 RepID=A0A512HMH6_9HYPH|nr:MULTISPECIES: UPF0280 family protein [Alphaproteobacteria]GEO86647.1 hypothetical protein RNA01_35790 [Ciceribacter naphthalenivorans]GLR23623.1 hypothetical protein GCM10007920_34150 [Ciceribacter naphthalenivorans]GLT06479.1 hypothetical protein GCM10007926_34150 [Sphingomonas psychrolutea]
MGRPTAYYLDGHKEGRLHLQHGPIDLVIGVDGEGPGISEQRTAAFNAAFARLSTILDELVAELPLLKQAVRPGSIRPENPVARRMMEAVRPFAAYRFITPMAAVAGAVADEVLAAMLAVFPADRRPARIYVNNGGDIALHQEPGAEFRVRMAREDGIAFGDLRIGHDDPSRGIATSGRGGRSLSMGIADSVTVAAASAAIADAAATLVANAVDLPGHPSIARARAVDLVDDSDLGERLVVTGCAALTFAELDAALAAGVSEAERFIAQGLVHRAGLFLRSEGRLVAVPSCNHSHFIRSSPLPAEHRRHA